MSVPPQWPLRPSAHDGRHGTHKWSETGQHANNWLTGFRPSRSTAASSRQTLGRQRGTGRPSGPSTAAGPQERWNSRCLPIRPLGSQSPISAQSRRRRPRSPEAGNSTGSATTSRLFVPRPLAMPYERLTSSGNTWPMSAVTLSPFESSLTSDSPHLARPIRFRAVILRHGHADCCCWSFQTAAGRACLSRLSRTGGSCHDPRCTAIAGGPIYPSERTPSNPILRRHLTKDLPRPDVLVGIRGERASSLLRIDNTIPSQLWDTPSAPGTSILVCSRRSSPADEPSPFLPLATHRGQRSSRSWLGRMPQ